MSPSAAALSPRDRDGEPRRIAIPLGDGAPGTVNAYLLAGPGGSVLVDTGWDTTEARLAIEEACTTAGVRLADLRLIVLTHAHPDHAGLAAWLRDRTGAPIALHQADTPLVDPDHLRDDRWLDETLAWLRGEGLPVAEADAAGEAFRRFGARLTPFRPDRLLRDGEDLLLAGRHYHVCWLPGHAPGHVCLFDAARGLLLSGDHVLERITPNIGLTAAAGERPLPDYLDSLRRTRALPVELILPGHGAPFVGLAARVDALLVHHEARCAELRAALGSARLTAFDLCARLTWAGGRAQWAELSPLQHALALAETVAHAQVLVERGLVARHAGQDGNHHTYTRASAT